MDISESVSGVYFFVLSVVLFGIPSLAIATPSVTCSESGGTYPYPGSKNLYVVDAESFAQEFGWTKFDTNSPPQLTSLELQHFKGWGQAYLRRLY